MKNLICVLVLGVFVLGMGCSRPPAPPEPLALEQFPAELDKAYAKCSAEATELVGKLKTSLQEKDYAAAYQTLQALTGLADATSDQRKFLTRANLTVYALVQTAQSSGDEKATAVINDYKASK
jgi:hypothetical protein